MRGTVPGADAMEGLETGEDAALLGTSSDSGEEDCKVDEEGGMAASRSGEEEQGRPHRDATACLTHGNPTDTLLCKVSVEKRLSLRLCSGVRGVTTTMNHSRCVSMCLMYVKLLFKHLRMQSDVHVYMLVPDLQIQQRQ